MSNYNDTYIQTCWYGKIDNLHAYYDGNQLQRVEDNISEDGNGNVNGNRNGRQSMYLFPGGYCNLNDPTVTGTGNPSTDSISYHYYNKDHLGNNREVINESGAIEQIVHYYPFGTPFTDGSSTNIGLQPYLYGNKELDMMHGLNTYDFGARNYNPLLGQFTTMDRFCTKYFSVSPYSYCMGNPMSNIDVNGDSLFLSGKVEDINRLISVYEKGMGNLSLVSYDYNTGAVLMNTITEDQYASLSNSQKKVYSKLNEIINNSGVTKLNVTNNDNKVIIGLIGENTLDIGDILQFSNNKYISDVSMAIHETYENYLVQIEKMDVNNAHAKASRFETNITGFIIGLKRDLPNNGTGLLKIKIYDSQIPKNPLITTINVSLRRNNVKEIYND